MDTAGEELRKMVQDITLSKLNSLLELSVRTSIAESDPYKDDLTCVLLPYNLMMQLMKIIHIADGSIQVNTAFMKEKFVSSSKLTGTIYCKSNRFHRSWSLHIWLQSSVAIVVDHQPKEPHQVPTHFPASFPL